MGCYQKREILTHHKMSWVVYMMVHIVFSCPGIAEHRLICQINKLILISVECNDMLVS